jgi:hypothetical protein
MKTITAPTPVQNGIIVVRAARAGHYADEEIVERQRPRTKRIGARSLSVATQRQKVSNFC